MPRKKILFCGTPQFAVPTLERLLSDDRYTVAAVITQPDRPSGRGHKLAPPPVKILAANHNLPVFQPTALRGLSFDGTDFSANSPDTELARFVRWHATAVGIDAVVVVAYGRILPPAFLDFPQAGCINVHASLLPRWRGAAPIQHALLEGDTMTGICIMRMEETLDTGPVYVREEIAIGAADSYGTLHDRLAALGAKLLADHLPAITAGTMVPNPQPEDGITYAPKWLRSDATIHWEEAADRIVHRIRACCPTPGARATLDGEAVRILRAQVSSDYSGNPALPGTVVKVAVEQSSIGLVVAAGDGHYINIEEMQFPGKKPLAIADILRGRRITAGQRFFTQL